MGYIEPMADGGLFVLSIIIGVIIAGVIFKVVLDLSKNNGIKQVPHNNNPAFSLTVKLIENNTAAYLTWTQAMGVVNGYRLFRESPQGSGFYCIVNNIGPNVTSWVDRGLNPQTAYAYQVIVL